MPQRDLLALVHHNLPFMWPYAPFPFNMYDIGFLRQKLRKRKLGSMVKTMKEKGDLDKNKRLTNTSARKYFVQKLRENNFQGTDKMQIPGHKNVASVNNYIIISEKQQNNISNILSNTTGENMVVVPYTPRTQSESNLPRRTSTITGPLATPTISVPAFYQSDNDKS